MSFVSCVSVRVHSFGRVPRSELSELYLILYRILGSLLNHFVFYILTSNVERFQFLPTTSFTSVLLSDNDHPHGYKMVSHCSFDSHFPLHVCVGSLSILFEEIPIEVLCSFLVVVGTIPLFT